MGFSGSTAGVLTGQHFPSWAFLLLLLKSRGRGVPFSYPGGASYWSGRPTFLGVNFGSQFWCAEKKAKNDRSPASSRGPAWPLGVPLGGCGRPTHPHPTHPLGVQNYKKIPVPQRVGVYIWSRNQKPPDGKTIWGALISRPNVNSSFVFGRGSCFTSKQNSNPQKKYIIPKTSFCILILKTPHPKID